MLGTEKEKSRGRLVFISEMKGRGYRHTPLGHSL
jgi:hypothetical protein